MTSCEHWDCGFCYAPYYLKTNAINGACNNPYKCPISPLSEPVQYETPMTEIEEVKAQLKVLQKKLSFLEELEKTKSPMEEAYKDWWGQYPETGTWDGFDEKRWQGFQAGYEFAYAISTAKEVMEKVQEEQKWDAVRESVKWCEENPDKDPLDYLKPQTPEQTSQSLKEAFVEAQKTEKWKEIQKLIDEEDNDKNFKNSLDLIKEWGEKNKPPTLYEKLEEWVDYGNFAQSKDVLVNEIVNIVKDWLPPSNDKNSYEWEKCLKMMYGNLR